MKTLSLLFALLMLCGCQTPATHGAHLTRSQAIDIAVRLAAENGVRLKDYRGPQVIFQPTTRQWLVEFHRENSSGEYIGFFTVNIDDETKTPTWLPTN
jgi:uncharacterized lipoprotein YajG